MGFRPPTTTRHDPTTARHTGPATLGEPVPEPEVVH